MNQNAAALCVYSAAVLWIVFQRNRTERRALDGTVGMLLDVRSVFEYNAGHFKGAVNIPRTEIHAGHAALPADKNTFILVYCSSGARAKLAVDKLKSIGYGKVRSARRHYGHS